MTHSITSYLKFLVSSTNEFGIHSPFVFDFVKKGLKTNLSLDSTTLKKYRKPLIQDKRKIKVKDFGAGSKIFKSDRRIISDIARAAGISFKRAVILANIVAYFESKKILEIGTSLGIATASLSLGNPKGEIISLEGCPETANVAQEYFDKFNLKNIKLQVGPFAETLPIVLKGNIYDLIYFDGNHTKDATIEYFNKSIKTKHNDSVFIFDDIHWSSEMEEAWNYIKNHKEVTITIDTFQWGIVFFRKEQLKEHYVIRL